MNTFLRKLTLISVLAVLVVVGSMYLFALRPIVPAEVSASPIDASVSLPTPADSMEPSVSLFAMAATTVQPKITWSSTSIEAILSPGESTSKDITFSSSLKLSNVVVEPVTTLAPFVSVQPNSFASVPANQAQPVHISISVPAGATLGTYDGTIHLRSGTTTYPRTVKVVVNSWKAVSSTAGGFFIKIPPFFSQQVDPTTGAVRVQNFVPTDNHILAQGEMYMRVFKSTAERLGDIRTHIDNPEQFSSNGGAAARGTRSDSFLGPHFGFDEYIIRDDGIWVIAATYWPSDTSSLQVAKTVMDSMRIP